jgi:hypothetical protein
MSLNTSIHPNPNYPDRIAYYSDLLRSIHVTICDDKITIKTHIATLTITANQLYRISCAITTFGGWPRDEVKMIDYAARHLVATYRPYMTEDWARFVETVIARTTKYLA